MTGVSSYEARNRIIFEACRAAAHLFSSFFVGLDQLIDFRKHWRESIRSSAGHSLHRSISLGADVGKGLLVPRGFDGTAGFPERRPMFMRDDGRQLAPPGGPRLRF